LSIGVLGLYVVETASLSFREGSARNPADANTKDPDSKPVPGQTALPRVVTQVLDQAPLPEAIKAKPHQALSRVIACLALCGLVTSLVFVGWRHFERPISGLAVAGCYLLLPYSRFALVDSGQLVPAALIVTALAFYRSPWVSGPLLGFSAAWMPASIGLIPLWIGFYRGKGAWRFALSACSVVIAGILIGVISSGTKDWALALGARTLNEAGFWPTSEPPDAGSFWSGIDASYRLPVWIGYVALVISTALWPAHKNLGELIAASAALLVASQFWYLSAGGTLVLLYLPLVILMMFRPTLGLRRQTMAPTASRVPKAVNAEV
jgi:hypothetical protein